MLTLRHQNSELSGKGCEPSVAGPGWRQGRHRSAHNRKTWQSSERLHWSHLIRKLHMNGWQLIEMQNAPARAPKGKFAAQNLVSAQRGAGTVEGKPWPCFGDLCKLVHPWLLTAQTDGVVTVGGDVSQTLTHFYLQAWVHASPKLPPSELFRRMRKMFKKNDIWESHNLSASFSSSSVNSQQVSYSLPILCLPFLHVSFPVSFSL